MVLFPNPIYQLSAWLKDSNTRIWPKFYVLTLSRATAPWPISIFTRVITSIDLFPLANPLHQKPKSPLLAPLPPHNHEGGTQNHHKNHISAQLFLTISTPQILSYLHLQTRNQWLTSQPHKYSSMLFCPQNNNKWIMPTASFLNFLLSLLFTFWNVRTVDQSCSTWRHRQPITHPYFPPVEIIPK